LPTGYYISLVYMKNLTAGTNQHIVIRLTDALLPNEDILTRLLSGGEEALEVGSDISKGFDSAQNHDIEIANTGGVAWETSGVEISIRMDKYLG